METVVIVGAVILVVAHNVILMLVPKVSPKLYSLSGEPPVFTNAVIRRDLAFFRAIFSKEFSSDSLAFLFRLYGVVTIPSMLLVIGALLYVMFKSVTA